MAEEVDDGTRRYEAGCHVSSRWQAFLAAHLSLLTMVARYRFLDFRQITSTERQ